MKFNELKKCILRQNNKKKKLSKGIVRHQGVSRSMSHFERECILNLLKALMTFFNCIITISLDILHFSVDVRHTLNTRLDMGIVRHCNANRNI